MRTRLIFDVYNFDLISSEENCRPEIAGAG